MSSKTFIALKLPGGDLCKMSQGQRIEERMKALDIKKTALCKLVPVSRPSLDDWIAGANISPRKLHDLARVLETSPEYIQYGRLEASEGSGYLPIDVMPTFAGMGGGGSGDGEIAKAWVARSLVEDELKAQPSDLTMIDVRGDSMEPMFLHGDQIIIDRRDKNPIQPGAFCIWDGDGYVIKKIERVPGRKGFYRVFSQNTDYTEYELEEDAIKIMGRPVWFARRI